MQRYRCINLTYKTSTSLFSARWQIHTNAVACDNNNNPFSFSLFCSPYSLSFVRVRVRCQERLSRLSHDFQAKEWRERERERTLRKFPIKNTNTLAIGASAFFCCHSKCILCLVVVVVLGRARPRETFLEDSISEALS